MRAWFKRLWKKLRHGTPKLGDLVRHEGYSYRVAELRQGLAVLRPEPNDAAPWREVTCAVADLQRGSAEGFLDAVRAEVADLRAGVQNLPPSPRRTRIEEFIEAQPDALAQRFPDPSAYWYLAGRLVDRRALRSLK